jgi:hypothetical protein
MREWFRLLPEIFKFRYQAWAAAKIAGVYHRALLEVGGVEKFRRPRHHDGRQL